MLQKEDSDWQAMLADPTAQAAKVEVATIVRRQLEYTMLQCFRGRLSMAVRHLQKAAAAEAALEELLEQEKTEEQQNKARKAKRQNRKQARRKAKAKAKATDTSKAAAGCGGSAGAGDDAGAGARADAGDGDAAVGRMSPIAAVDPPPPAGGASAKLGLLPVSREADSEDDDDGGDWITPMPLHGHGHRRQGSAPAVASSTPMEAPAPAPAAPGTSAFTPSSAPTPASESTPASAPFAVSAVVSAPPPTATNVQGRAAATSRKERQRERRARGDARPKGPRPVHAVDVCGARRRIVGQLPSKWVICGAWRAGKCTPKHSSCEFAHGVQYLTKWGYYSCKHVYCKLNVLGKCPLTAEYCIYAHTLVDYSEFHNRAVPQDAAPGAVPPWVVLGGIHNAEGASIAVADVVDAPTPWPPRRGPPPEPSAPPPQRSRAVTASGSRRSSVSSAGKVKGQGRATSGAGSGSAAAGSGSSFGPFIPAAMESSGWGMQTAAAPPAKPKSKGKAKPASGTDQPSAVGAGPPSKPPRPLLAPTMGLWEVSESTSTPASSAAAAPPATTMAAPTPSTARGSTSSMAPPASATVRELGALVAPAPAPSPPPAAAGLPPRPPPGLRFPSAPAATAAPTRPVLGPTSIAPVVAPSVPTAVGPAVPGQAPGALFSWAAGGGIDLSSTVQSLAPSEVRRQRSAPAAHVAPAPFGLPPGLRTVDMPPRAPPGLSPAAAGPPRGLPPGLSSAKPPPGLPTPQHSAAVVGPLPAAAPPPSPFLLGVPGLTVLPAGPAAPLRAVTHPLPSWHAPGLPGVSLARSGVGVAGAGAGAGAGGGGGAGAGGSPWPPAAAVAHGMLPGFPPGHTLTSAVTAPTSAAVSSSTTPGSSATPTSTTDQTQWSPLPSGLRW